MKFQTLKRSHLKRNILIGVVAAAIISATVLNFTRARYRVTQSIPLVNGIINYTPYDLNIVALYIDGVEAETLDSNTNYTLDTENSTCTYQDGTEISNLTLSYDSTTKSFSISPYTTRGTKCTLYFDSDPCGPACQAILANNPTISDARSGNITGTLTTNTTGTIYTKEDEDGTSYFFAGNTTNNWVSFAGYYWRIIRINEDGSIRMIYNGTTTDQTGSGTQLQTSAYNNSYNDNAYVGYMYGSGGASSYSATHTNTNDSTIKGILDDWYHDHIYNTDYEDSISMEAGFCNDRRIATSSETWWSDDTKRGYGTNITAYAPWFRFMTTIGMYNSTQTPTLECSQENDLFTVISSSKGNHDLDYPVGLITADEVVLAGGFAGSTNSSYYLNTNQDYWTMSPFYFDGSTAWVFHVLPGGALNDYDWANGMYGVRPVINLRSDVTLTGSGTASDPYKVV